MADAAVSPGAFQKFEVPIGSYMLIPSPLFQGCQLYGIPDTNIDLRNQGYGIQLQAGSVAPKRLGWNRNHDMRA